MDWNQITELPLFWRPFHSLGLTLVAIPPVPALLALLVGFAMFKRRVGGTCFAIITQAIAAILTILIIGQQGYTGGVNGITDLRTLHGWDIRTDQARVALYFVNAVLLIAYLLLGQYVRRSKLGRILVAMRDKEDRVRFSGYAVADFKIFVFCFAAALAGIGGAMFTLQVGFMSPSFVGIVPSIEMVIFCAVGGRTSLLGAAARSVFLHDQLDRPAGILSHGQKQWLEIGMLLIQGPALLMLDEPVAGMSVSERAKTAELLRRIIQRRSVLVIEHDMGFVESIADKVMVLHQSRVISEGSIAHVKAALTADQVFAGG